MEQVLNAMADKKVLFIWFLWIVILCIIAKVIIEIIDKKRAKKRRERAIERMKQEKIYQDAMKWRQQERKKQYESYRKNFKKEYLNIIKEH